MGTVWTVQVLAPADPAPRALFDTVQQALDLVVQQMSHWDEGSDLGRYNAAPAGSWLPLPEPFWTVLACALRVARLSGGAFDPAAGALVDAWGFASRNRHDQPGFVWPEPARLQRLLVSGPQAGWRGVRMDEATRRVWQPGGVRLDLAAVAKGFAVDLVSARLREAGWHHHLVEVGGELRGEGMKPDLQPWWVALEAPSDAGAPDPDAALLASLPVLALHGLAVATSGDHRRCLWHEGRRYAHTIDPRTGWPADHGLASVSVLHPECMVADAMSTAIMVMGLRQGLAFADDQGVAACLIQRDGVNLVAHLSAAMKAMCA